MRLIKQVVYFVHNTSNVLETSHPYKVFCYGVHVGNGLRIPETEIWSFGSLIKAHLVTLYVPLCEFKFTSHYLTVVYIAERT